MNNSRYNSRGKGGNHANGNQANGNRSYGGVSNRGSGASGQGGNRPVSSNYTVDLFHHHVGAQSNQPGKPERGKPKFQRSGPPSRGGVGKTGFTKRNSEPKKAIARKGYVNCNFEMKDDLYKKFTEKLKDSSKTPKEVISQLVSFYNMGKIKI